MTTTTKSVPLSLMEISYIEKDGVAFYPPEQIVRHVSYEADYWMMHLQTLIEEHPRLFSENRVLRQENRYFLSKTGVLALLAMAKGSRSLRGVYAAIVDL
ncbi:MAG: hypothetical protein ABW189_05590 [Rickettsiales bacterium]